MRKKEVDIEKDFAEAIESSLANHRQKPWKAPFPVFIENCYYKRFRKKRPENVRSIEQMVKDKNQKREKKRKRKRQKMDQP